MNGMNEIPESEMGGFTIPVTVPFPCGYHNGYYYARNDQEEDRYVKLTEGGMKRRLKQHGVTTTDSALEYITQNYAVDYVGPIAGYPAGICVNNGTKCLVTNAAPQIQAIKGDWPIVEELLKGVLHEEQMCYVCAVLQAAIWRLVNQADSQIQAMAFIGGQNIGKTFIQKYIITPLLGRVTNPTQYILGITAFSKDLGGAEHLMISDEHTHFTAKARDLMYDFIKQVTVNSAQRVHPKGTDALQLDVRTILTISCNDSNDRDLKVIPNLDNILMPRLHVFRCYEDAKHLFKPSQAEQEVFKQTILKEIPAFKYYLINEWRTPAWAKDPDNRFACRAYHDIEITSRLESMSREHLILEIIYEYLFNDESDTHVYETSAITLLTSLRQSNQRESVDRLVKDPRELGELLSRLKDSQSKIVKLGRKSNGTNMWELYHPKLDGKMRDDEAPLQLGRLSRLPPVGHGLGIDLTRVKKAKIRDLPDS